jgi:CheY-like chemotaxis protein
MREDDAFDPSGLSALVLDENHYERGITLDLLRGMGFGRAQGAANTMEAWDLIKKTNPSIVLLEWIDSAHSGLDFARRVRQSEDVPNRAVSMFILTARGTQADVERARMAGLDGFLRKPISAVALRQRVRVARSPSSSPPPMSARAGAAGGPISTIWVRCAASTTRRKPQRKQTRKST